MSFRCKYYNPAPTDKFFTTQNRCCGTCLNFNNSKCDREEDIKNYEKEVVINDKVE